MHSHSQGEKKILIRAYHLVFFSKEMGVSDFLSRTPDRDKIMALFQFVPMALSGPAMALAGKDAAQHLLKLSEIAEIYRVVTRFSGMFDCTTEEKLAALGAVKCPILRKVSLVEFFCQFMFFPMEHMTLLSTAGIVHKSKSQTYLGLTLFFWLWSLLMSVVRLTMTIIHEWPHIQSQPKDTEGVKRKAEFRKNVLKLTKALCMTIFCISNLPQGKPQLLAKPRGLFLPLHRLIEMLSPNRLSLSTTTQGLLATIGSVTDLL